MFKNISKILSHLIQRVLATLAQLFGRSALIAETAWAKSGFRLASYLILTLLLGFWLGGLLKVTEVPQITAEKAIEVDKTGTITVSLPGVVLDAEVFHFEPAKSSIVPLEMSVPGKLVFNAEKTKVMSARVAGRVERIYTFDGAPVKAGQAMADFYSPDYVSAQHEYLLSNQMLKTLNGTSMSSLIEDAKSTLDASTTHLKLLGAAEEDIQRLKNGGQPTTTFPMRSPIDGIVIKRAIDPGAYMNVGDILATIADPKSLWFMGNVYEQDIKKISKGQILKLRSETYPDREFIAKANYLSPSIDPVTHALMIRCDVENNDGALRPEMFVNGKLEIGKTQAIVVPRTALIQVKTLKFVIVKDGDNYHRIPVSGFDMGDDSFAITQGVSVGDKILVIGAILMDQRFMKQED